MNNSDDEPIMDVDPLDEVDYAITHAAETYLGTIYREIQGLETLPRNLAEEITAMVTFGRISIDDPILTKIRSEFNQVDQAIISNFNDIFVAPIPPNLNTLNSLRQIDNKRYTLKFIRSSLGGYNDHLLSALTFTEAMSLGELDEKQLQILLDHMKTKDLTFLTEEARVWSGFTNFPIHLITSLKDLEINNIEALLENNCLDIFEFLAWKKDYNTASFQRTFEALSSNSLIQEENWLKPFYDAGYDEFDINNNMKGIRILFKIGTTYSQLLNMDLANARITILNSSRCYTSENEAAGQYLLEKMQRHGHSFIDGSRLNTSNISPRRR